MANGHGNQRSTVGPSEHPGAMAWHAWKTYAMYGMLQPSGSAAKLPMPNLQSWSMEITT